MKRIGLFTIIDYLNYGNRLQNYAAQEVLRSLGFEVETILNEAARPEISRSEYIKNRIRNALRQSPLKLLQKAFNKFRDSKNKAFYEECRRKRALSFEAFSRRYICESDFRLIPGRLYENLDERYDFCVAGSDQIWNPHIRFGSSLDFLSFVPAPKRLAYAPSFGVAEIPDRYRQRYSQYLSEMATLSVREERGAEIIRDLCGREAKVLVDPTLMLDSSSWEAVAVPARHRPAKEYLLTYFIGALSAERKATLQALAAVKKLEIVQLASFDDPLRYDADPGEFVDYISRAALVCTDSFHSCIFAMLAGRPFVVFEREGKSAEMSSRLETLLKKFNFADRKYNTDRALEEWFAIDYSHFATLLEVERLQALAYLKSALNVQC
ncbi:MAG: polysaccharide pyruvyl transferase family protein [Bacteroidales bacterium]|nr:polysaccharide pyruvyl transferase family protein [Bacteroidales bacterium]